MPPTTAKVTTRSMARTNARTKASPTPKLAYWPIFKCQERQVVKPRVVVRVSNTEGCAMVDVAEQKKKAKKTSKGRKKKPKKTSKGEKKKPKKMSKGDKIAQDTEAIKLEPFTNLLDHAGVDSWRNFRKKFPSCRHIDLPAKDAYAYWDESQVDEWTNSLATYDKIAVYNALTLDQKMPYLNQAWPFYLEYYGQLGAWYKDVIGQYSAPYYRR